MGELRKITIEVDADQLEAARAEGSGVTETIREAIRDLAHKRASQRLLALRGKLKFDLTWQELRGKNDE